MLALGILGGLLAIAIIFVSILLIGLVLLQKNKGAGLSGAFGGVGGHSAFGTKTGDVMTWLTVGLTALFLLLNIGGTYVFEPESRQKPAVIEADPLTGEAGDAPAPVDATEDVPAAGDTGTDSGQPANPN